MCAKNRRKERRKDILTKLANEFNFEIREIKDLTFYEENEKFLEGFVNREHEKIKSKSDLFN